MPQPIKLIGVRMKVLSFYLVDVFAEEKYSGNQLAVVADAGKLSTGQMQRIANEFHFSETTFMISDSMRNGGYDVRIFTPQTELPFAGHPTLGTAFVIRHCISDKKVDKITLNLKVGQIPVVFEKDEKGDDILWMHQLSPTFGRTFDSLTIANLLNLEVKDVDERFPVQEVSTGIPFIIVPLKNLDAVKRARTDRAKQYGLAKDRSGGILVFSPKTYSEENDLNVRVFVDLLGIPEDPATGSGNGCLAGYLCRHSYFGNDKINVRVEQGYEIMRPSLLRLKAERHEDKIDVRVGGKITLIATGKLE
jgi:trans-2,3-dihydro-3-hydroxyanthranilate isomerase